MKTGSGGGGQAAATAPRARRREGLHERLVEVVDVREVLSAIAVGFAEDIIFDQIEDDVAEVRTAADAPGGEHGLGERTVLLQGIRADAFKEFGPGHMLRLAGALRILALRLLDGVVQRLPDKVVGLAVKAGVFFTNQPDDFGKFQVLHEFQGQ